MAQLFKPQRFSIHQMKQYVYIKKIPRTKQLYKKETCLKLRVLDVSRNDIISQVLMANGNIVTEALGRLETASPDRKPKTKQKESVLQPPTPPTQPCHWKGPIAA